MLNKFFFLIYKKRGDNSKIAEGGKERWDEGNL